MNGAAVISHQPTAADIERSQMTAFTGYCATESGRPLSDYPELHAWSVTQLRDFWRLFLRWADPLMDGEVEPVCHGDACETARFFPEVRLNYAENLLRPLGPDSDRRTAVTSLDESGRVIRLTRGELRSRVAQVATGLAGLGVGPGDRVVAIARNDAESVVACLAATAIGATWSSTGPDLGTDAVLARFRQLAPKVIFAHSEYSYHGARKPLADRIAEVTTALPSLTHLVRLGEGAEPLTGGRLPEHSLDDLATSGSGAATPWPRLPFNHPLFILFSSGTTGVPKCIVHGAGGTLLEHLKEHRLHGDFGPGDKLCFQTACGWMMWNWQLSALASGTEIVLYDGSVSFPDPDSLLQRLAGEGVTIFGTSAAYLAYCRDAGLNPRRDIRWPALRAIQSTGSILYDAQFDWVTENIKPVPIQSISGGTDIIGCFVLGNPNLPVYRGESQCLSLGLDVRAMLPSGEAATEGTGELVCANPFPSRPVHLFGDPDGTRFHEAYFSQNPGYWTHGDVIQLSSRGTARILGRSDGTLNVRGVRIGPAEIYQIILGIPGVAEGMAVEQLAPSEPGGSRLVLLVVLAPGTTLDRPLTLRIKRELSQRGSPNHVPAVIAQVSGLPTTHSGKRSERAARDALNGRPVVNVEALRNPECLDEFRNHPALRIEAKG